MKYVHQAADVLKLEINQLLQTFFGDANMRHIQNKLVNEVQKETRYTIDEQSYDEIYIAMQYIFVNFARHCTLNHLNYLNDLVLHELVPMVVSNVKLHMGYLQDICTLHTPIEHSKSTTNKGSQVNEFKSFF
tara:strand:+ start:156 stop:551 length:396 start_codon:yes stop_codon:yes gene_type:complete